MANKTLTDEQVEQEIARLQQSSHVKLYNQEVDLFLNFFYFRIQYLNKLDRVFQLQGLCRHSGTNGVSGSIPYLNSLLSVVMTSGGG